eukprot:3971018-Prymnesium_polylepis.1
MDEVRGTPPGEWPAVRSPRSPHLPLPPSRRAACRSGSLHIISPLPCTGWLAGRILAQPWAGDANQERLGREAADRPPHVQQAVAAQVARAAPARDRLVQPAQLDPARLPHARADGD